MSGFNATEQLQGQGELNDFTFQASAAGWTIFALMTIIFWMRTAARFWYTEASLGIEDIIISVSWVCLFSGLCLRCTDILLAV